jgi:DNA-binding response OmpR family regulator
MEKRIFIVDDEIAMSKIATKFLERDHYAVKNDTNPVQALQKIKADPPDLVLLDICMPGMNGLDFCRKMKEDPKTAHVPIIFLSVKSEESDVVVGLELGAEDYIRKPLRGPEFLARVKAALRRHESPLPRQQLELGPFQVDLGTYKASLAGENLELTPKQLELLAFFIRNPGRVLTRTTISMNVWGADLTGSSRAIDSAVDQLRRQLGRYRNCIEGLRGVGYRFEVDD